MLVRLAPWEKDGYLDGVMHVNPTHIVRIFQRDDGQPFMMLSGYRYNWNINMWEQDSYAIDRESYKRIVEWMERKDEVKTA